MSLENTKLVFGCIKDFVWRKCNWNILFDDPKILDVNDERKCNVLHECCSISGYSNKRDKLIEYFVEKGVNINAQDFLGRTPLIYYVRRLTCQNTNIVSLLISDHNINYVDIHKKDAADYACSCIKQKLFQKGARYKKKFADLFIEGLLVQLESDLRLIKEDTLNDTILWKMDLENDAEHVYFQPYHQVPEFLNTIKDDLDDISILEDIQNVLKEIAQYSHFEKGQRKKQKTYAEEFEKSIK